MRRAPESEIRSVHRPLAGLGLGPARVYLAQHFRGPETLRAAGPADDVPVRAIWRGWGHGRARGCLKRRVRPIPHNVAPWFMVAPVLKTPQDDIGSRDCLYRCGESTFKKISLLATAGGTGPRNQARRCTRARAGHLTTVVQQRLEEMRAQCEQNIAHERREHKAQQRRWVPNLLLLLAETVQTPILKIAQQTATPPLIQAGFSMKGDFLNSENKLDWRLHQYQSSPITFSVLGPV